MASPLSGELGAIARLASRLEVEEGELGVGDDAAVVVVRGGTLLFCQDLVVENIHVKREFSSLSDVGWKAIAVNVSDVAAMGGRPTRCLVGVAGLSGTELDLLYDGILEAATAYECRVVGGDLCDAERFVVSVAMIGVAERPVRRDGGKNKDLIFVTGPLGASAAGLRLLSSDLRATGPLVDAHRRPKARLSLGLVAAEAGATAMIDLSDGLGLDLRRLAGASGVGFRLSEVPVANGATLEEAIGGGEDYELVFTAPDREAVYSAFSREGLPEPIEIGTLVEDPSLGLLGTAPLPSTGYEHQL